MGIQTIAQGLSPGPMEAAKDFFILRLNDPDGNLVVLASAKRSWGRPPHLIQGEIMLQKSPMFAYLPASDMARARAFYEGKLGFTPGEEIEGGVSYACASGTSCFLYPTPNAGTNTASQAFWQVADIEKEVAELKAKGITLEQYGMPGQDEDGIMTAGRIKNAWFKDTEGNILAIIQSD